MSEDPLTTLENMLVDPAMIAKGKTFISDVEYAIYLIKQHRLKK